MKAELLIPKYQLKGVSQNIYLQSIQLFPPIQISLQQLSFRIVISFMVNARVPKWWPVGTMWPPNVICFAFTILSHSILKRPFYIKIQISTLSSSGNTGSTLLMPTTGWRRSVSLGQGKHSASPQTLPCPIAPQHWAWESVAIIILPLLLFCLYKYN